MKPVRMINSGHSYQSGFPNWFLRQSRLGGGGGGDATDSTSLQHNELKPLSPSTAYIGAVHIYPDVAADARAINPRILMLINSHYCRGENPGIVLVRSIEPRFSCIVLQCCIPGTSICCLLYLALRPSAVFCTCLKDLLLSSVRYLRYLV